MSGAYASLVPRLSGLVPREPGYEARPVRDVQVGTPASCTIVSIDNLEVLQAVVYYCSLEYSGSHSCMHNERYIHLLAVV